MSIYNEEIRLSSLLFFFFFLSLFNRQEIEPAFWGILLSVLL